MPMRSAREDPRRPKDPDRPAAPAAPDAASDTRGPGAVLALQRTVGNAGVQRLLASPGVVQRNGDVLVQGGVYDVHFNPSGGRGSKDALSGGSGGEDRPPPGFGGKRPNEGHYYSPYFEVDQEAIDEYYRDLDRLEASLDGPKRGTAKEAPREEDRYGRGRFADRLALRYPGVHPGVIRHMAATKAILTDRAYSERALLRLQREMERRGVSLDVVLSEEEERQGFRPREEVTGILSREAFLDNLANARHIFDAGTPPEHGPHSHRMQWYILYMAHGDGRLRIPPVYLYGLLSLPVMNDPRSPLRAAWDDLFDFDAEAAELMELPEGNSVEENRQAAVYSSPEGMQGRLVSGGTALGQGALVRELRDLAYQYNHFGTVGVLDFQDALIGGIIMQTALRDELDQWAQFALQLELSSLGIDELEERYANLVRGYVRRRDRK